MIWLAAAGACAGLGIVLVIAELWPAPPRLDAVLARIHDAPGPAPQPGPGRAADRLGRWLAARLGRTRLAAIPRADLSLLGRPPETFLVHKLAASSAGLAAFALTGAFLAVTGSGVP